MWTYGISHLLLRSLAAAVRHRGCGFFPLESGLNFAPCKVTEQEINVIHTKKSLWSLRPCSWRQLLYPLTP